MTLVQSPSRHRPAVRGITAGLAEAVVAPIPHEIYCGIGSRVARRYEEAAR